MQSSIWVYVFITFLLLAFTQNITGDLKIPTTTVDWKPPVDQISEIENSQFYNITIGTPKESDQDGFSGDFVKTPTKEVEIALRRQQIRLRSLVEVLFLKNPGIQWLEDRLKKDILDLGNFVRRVDPTNDVHLRQLLFVEHMLKFVVESSKIMNFYEPGKSKDQTLIVRMIQFNARLLELTDMYGYPDPLIKGYKKTISLLSRTLNSCELVYGNLEDIPLRSKLVLRYQFKQARESIALFKNSIPESEV